MEKIRGAGIAVRRVFGVVIAKEATAVKVKDSPCGHDECGGFKIEVQDEVLAFGLSERRTLRRAILVLARRAAQAWEAEQAREASEALGG